MVRTAAVLRSLSEYWAGRYRGGHVLVSGLMILGLALPNAVSLEAAGRAGGRILLSATAGGGAINPRVYLRWVVTEGPAPYATFLLKRREDAEAAFIDLATVARLDDPAAVEAVFPVPSEIRDELAGIFQLEPGETLSAALLALRGFTDPASRMQYRMVQNTNYGVAIAEGVAYLDTTVVAGTRYLYELWGVDPGFGLPAERLGKVWVLAGTDTMLPKPEGLDAVRVADVDRLPLGNFPTPADGDIDVDLDGKLDSGEFGDGKIYLTWKPNRLVSPKDRETEPIGFGYDILRSDKGELPVCPGAPPPGSVKVNERPVLSIAAPQDTKKMAEFFFVDDGSNLAIPPPVKGAVYCYWLAARNLLRQGGIPSDVKEACAPDLGRPRQVRDVTTQVKLPSSQGLAISWTPNTSDPVTLGGGSRYIDDTAAYHVYRFTEFKDLLQPLASFDSCAVAAPLEPCILCSVDPTLTSCTDAAPATDANRGKIYWYVVTALDTPMCGNPANESPYSGPARGVVYDETPPQVGTIMPFCDRPPPSPTNPELPCIRDCGCTPSTGNPCPADDDPWCLVGGASGIFARSGESWGYKVVPPMPTDTMSVRLYRGSKGSDFRPVHEGSFDPARGGWAVNEQPFQPRSSQKIEYRLRALDRDSNIGNSAAPSIPAFLQGAAPPPRPTIIRSTLDPALGTALIRWHAPGAEAFAGFMLRVGPAARRDIGAFTLLPDDPAQLASEMVPAPVDVDGDLVPEPDVIIIRNTTKYLADLANFGSLTRTGDGYFEYTVAVPEGVVVEVYSVDITGQLSEPAVTTPTPLEIIDLDTIPWPERTPPETPFALGAVFKDAASDYVELCWDRDEGDPGTIHPARVAVFRTVVEPGRPDGYQQRSPRVKIDDYMEAAPALVCSNECKADLDVAMGVGVPSAAGVVCWRDYGIFTGTTFRYTVLGFVGPPVITDPDGPASPTDPAIRNEGEIEAVYGRPGSPQGAAEVTVP